MTKTPSNRRRDGRNAFYPGGNPEESCPYKKDSWGYDMNLADFIDGWNEAKADYLVEMEDDVEDDVAVCSRCALLESQLEKLRTTTPIFFSHLSLF